MHRRRPGWCSARRAAASLGAALALSGVGSRPIASEPINGRVWLAEALTTGSFAQPEDPDQTADIDGQVVPLAALTVVVIRRLGTEPDMPLEDIADRVHLPLDEVLLAQAALEQVAADVGR